MTKRRGLHTRLSVLLAVLALLWGTAAAAAPGESGDRLPAAASAGTGRIRMAGVQIRSSQWISIGETGFHPDRTVLPGNSGRTEPPLRQATPAREPGTSAGGKSPPLPEPRMNRTEFPFRLSEAGIVGGFGFGRIPEGHYEPILMAAHFGLDVGRYFHLPGTHRGRLTFFLEPRFNPVHEPAGDYELGIGIGLQYVYPIFRHLFFYAAVSTGPHFISVRTEREARGFLVDSEAGGGFYIALGKGSALNVGYRIRHLSNGGVRTPNAGIDNHLLVVGYSMFLDVPEEKEREE
jgi:hypothetical protein